MSNSNYREFSAWRKENLSEYSCQCYFNWCEDHFSSKCNMMDTVVLKGKNPALAQEDINMCYECWREYYMTQLVKE